MVVATGFFDGVHLGHRFLIDSLVEAARSRGEESLVVTFWPHPRTVLQNDARSLRLLTSLEEKKALLEGLGVDRVAVLHFTRAFSRMTAREYLEEVIVGRFGASAVMLGYDNRIGSDCLGPEEVRGVAESLGLSVLSAPSFSTDGVTVSSTKIRSALSEGNVSRAGEMLGYHYGLHGVVVAGNRLGRTLGFPTANMQLYEPLKLLPGNGVYLVEVVLEGTLRHGMCNIGTRPTVGGSSVTVETHIFDFDEDIYGLDLRVAFLERIREEKRFSSLSELSAQLSRDRETCLQRLQGLAGI